MKGRNVSQVAVQKLELVNYARMTSRIDVNEIYSKRHNTIGIGWSRAKRELVFDCSWLYLPE